MATKDIVLRKKLIKEGILIVVVLAVLAVAGFALSNYDDDTQSEKTNTAAANTSIHGEHDSIQQELGAGFDVSAFYTLYFKSHNSNLTLNRESAGDWMAAAREKNHLANFSLTISPIADLAQDFAHLKSNVISKSDVTLAFGSITDSSIYNFIEAMESTLPGIVLIKDLKVSRTGDLSGNLMTELSHHHISPIVSCEISFVWLGLHSLETKDSATSNSSSIHGSPQ